MQGERGPPGRIGPPGEPGKQGFPGSPGEIVSTGLLLHDCMMTAWIVCMDCSMDCVPELQHGLCAWIAAWIVCIDCVHGLCALIVGMDCVCFSKIADKVTDVRGTLHNQ